MRQIMIVDDDPILLQTLEIFLKEHYQVAAFQKVESAIAYLEEQAVDIIFLDIRMPEISGIMAFDMIRKCKNGEQVPIIFLSGLSDKRTVTECIDLGASSYLLKPVNKTLLIETIETTLGTAGVPVVSSDKPLLLIITRLQEIKELIPALKEKYSVVTVSNVIQAAEVVKKNKPQLLLIDYELPVYNGVQTLQKVRESALEPKFGTVIIYHKLEVEQQKEAREARVLCMERPVKYQELLEQLERAQGM